MNNLGTYTEIKPVNIQELEVMLGIEFSLYKKTGSCYGELNGLRIRLSNHSSLSVENGRVDIDLNYENRTAKSLFNQINGINIFENIEIGAILLHKAEKIGNVTVLEHNTEKKYIKCQKQNGEVINYCYNAFSSYYSGIL